MKMRNLIQQKTFDEWISKDKYVTNINFEKNRIKFNYFVIRKKKS